MPPERIITDNAPRTDNLYSQGAITGDTLYVPGYDPVDPETGEEIDGDIGTQTNHVFNNIATIVSEAGGDGLGDAVKLTVYVTDLNDYEQTNKAYGMRFDEVLPTRVCVEVA